MFSAPAFLLNLLPLSVTRRGSSNLRRQALGHLDVGPVIDGPSDLMRDGFD